MLDRDIRYSVWIGGSLQKHVSAVVDVHPKILHTKVVLNDSVAMFQGIGEQTPKEYNVSHAVTVSVEVSLGTKLGQVEVSVRLHIDLTLSHSCAFFSLVTELLCALGHSSQDCHKAEFHVSLSLSLLSLFFLISFVSLFFFVFSCISISSLFGLFSVRCWVSELQIPCCCATTCFMV